jgi:hypothetical protein
MAMTMGVCPKAGVSACRADEYCTKEAWSWVEEREERAQDPLGHLMSLVFPFLQSRIIYVWSAAQAHVGELVFGLRS